jgi:hypothetical protein
MGHPANASSCALAWKLAKAELSRVSPNQIGHSADDEDDEANQTHLKQSVLERDAYLHCAQELSPNLGDGRAGQAAAVVG